MNQNQNLDPRINQGSESRTHFSKNPKFDEVERLYEQSRRFLTIKPGEIVTFEIDADNPNAIESVIVDSFGEKKQKINFRIIVLPERTNKILQITPKEAIKLIAQLRRKSGVRTIKATRKGYAKETEYFFKSMDIAETNADDLQRQLNTSPDF